MHRDPAVMAQLGGVRDEAQTAAYLARNLQHWADYGFGLWILRERGGGGGGNAFPRPMPHALQQVEPGAGNEEGEGEGEGSPSGAPCCATCSWTAP